MEVARVVIARRISRWRGNLGDVGDEIVGRAFEDKTGFVVGVVGPGKVDLRGGDGVGEEIAGRRRRGGRGLRGGAGDVGVK